MLSRRISSAFVAAAMFITTAVVSVPAAAAVSSWTDNGDGTFSYTQGGDATVEVPALDIAAQKPAATNWADVKYVSIDVAADNTAQPVIGGAFDGGDYTPGNSKWMQDGGTATVYFETDGKTPDFLQLDVWSISDNGNLTASNITFSTEEYVITDEWYEENGAWYYRAGKNGASKVFIGDFAPDTAWSGIKYVSLDVEVTGKAENMRLAVFNDTTENSMDGKPISLDNSSGTLYVESCGKDWTEANYWVEKLEAGTVVKLSNVKFSTEERDHSGLTNEWYTENGKWYYKNGNTAVDRINGLPLDLSSITDWSKIKYISADVTVDSKAKPVICGNVGSNINGTAKEVDNGTVTVYLDTDGKTVSGAGLEFWQYDDKNEMALSADALITVSNITFSTEPRDYSNVTGEWYEKDGKWYYKNGNTAVDRIDILPLNLSSVTDWSKIKYISADVTVDGKADPVISANTGDPDNDKDWSSGASKKAENNTVTVYFDNNGKAISAANLQFWRYDDNNALSANALITVSNIKFSTEERVITDEWYEKGGAWYFKAGEKGASEVFIGNFTPDTAWSGIKYASVDVEVKGNAKNMRLAVDKDTNHKEGKSISLDNSSGTLYVDTLGKDWIDANYWAESLEAGTVVKLSNIKFSTQPRDYSNVYDEWYQLDAGVFEYKDSGDGKIENEEVNVNLTDYFDDVDLSKVKCVSAKVTVDGRTQAGLILADDDWNRSKSGSFLERKSGWSLALIFNYNGGDWKNLIFDMWELDPGTKITISDVKFSATDYSDYRNVIGQWVQLGENDYYYNSGADLTDNYGGWIALRDSGYDMSNVQSISMRTKVVPGSGAEPWSGAKLNVGGTTDGDYNRGLIFSPSTEEQVITRKYRGMLDSDPQIEVNYIDPYVEVYVYDLTFSTEEIPVLLSSPNDVVVDDNETAIGNSAGEWTGAHNISWSYLSKIEVEGTLRFSVELTENSEDIHLVDPIWSNWTLPDDKGWIHIYDEAAAAAENCTMTIPITKDTLKMLHETAADQCEFVVQGTGIKVSNFIFTPKGITPVTTPEIFERIWSGSMPGIVSGQYADRNIYYSSYLSTYIGRDVRDISTSVDALKFNRFITAVAARISQLLNYKALADDADIDMITAKAWVNILETLGIIFLLHPYSNNVLKRTIKTPKIYFYDTGLVCYLTKWSSPEVAESGAMSGALLENFAVSEIMKSYLNAGLEPFIYFYRDRDAKEIDIVIEGDGKLCPLEIKKTAAPDKRIIKTFGVLDKASMEIGTSAVLCMAEQLGAFNRDNLIVPVWMI